MQVRSTRGSDEATMKRGVGIFVVFIMPSLIRHHLIQRRRSTEADLRSSRESFCVVTWKRASSIVLGDIVRGLSVDRTESSCAELLHLIPPLNERGSRYIPVICRGEIANEA